MRSRVLLLLLFFCLLNGGCWDQRVIEKMEFIVSAGVDARPGNRILLILITPSTKGGGDKTNIYMSETAGLRQGRERLRLQSAGQLEAGKMEQIFFGEEMARRGILDYLDILTRDPFNPIQARLVVVKGTARDFMMHASKWKNIPLCGLYLKRLLDYGISTGSIPPTDINRFQIDYYAPGIDPVAPLIKATPSRALLLGTALFRDDRLVGELDVDQTFLFLALRGEAGAYTQTFPIPKGLIIEKEVLSVRFVKAKAKSLLDLRSARPRVSFLLSFTGLLVEFRAGPPLKPEDLRRLERFAARSLEAELRKVWATLQELNTDPIGIGNLIRAYHHDFWEKHDWRQVFPRVEARFRVKVDLVNYGAIR